MPLPAGAHPLVCVCAGSRSVALALYAACHTLLDLSIKEFPAPGQQTGVMDLSVDGTVASPVSGAGGKTWDITLPKGAGEH